jgi:hypothetical protein
MFDNRRFKHGLSQTPIYLPNILANLQKKDEEIKTLLDANWAREDRKRAEEEEVVVVSSKKRKHSAPVAVAGESEEDGESETRGRARGGSCW